MRTLYNIFISRYFFGKFLGKFKFQFCSVLFSFVFVTVSFGQNSLSIDLFNTKESSFLRSSNSTDPNTKFIELDINETELNKLILSKPFELKFSIPTNLGTKKVQLTKVQIIASDFNIINEDGLSLNFDPILTYQGHIEGASNNIATFIFNENSIEASLLMDEKTYSITSGKQNNIIQHIFLEEINEGKINNFTCGTSDESEVNLEKSAEVFDINVVEANTSLSSKILNIHIECDNDLFVKSNRNVQILYKNIIRLFNSVNAIYRKEGIRISLSGLTIWQTKDPYTIGGGGNNLDQIAKRYIKRPNNVDIVHLLSSRQLGDGSLFGGLAKISNRWVDKTSLKSVNHTLCSDFPRKTTIGIECKLKFNPFKGHWRICDYQYKMNYFGPFSFSCNPEIIVDDNVWEFKNKDTWAIAKTMAHEIGHNLGSPHTHDCRWNNNATAIDNCGYGRDKKREGNCPPGPTPKKNGGTIMSYCHLIPTTVGVLISNGFGVQPGNLIRNTISRAKCVEVAAESSLQLSTNKVLIGKNQGSFTVKLTANSQNVFWSSTVGVNWLKLSKIAGQGSQDLVVQYDADNSNDFRSALITILTENNLQTITILQGDEFTPIIQTNNYTELTATTCKMGGEILSEGSSIVTGRGIVWGTTPNLDIKNNNKTEEGFGSGIFTSRITNLQPNITYYARAYASNKSGTTYGQPISFRYLDSCGAFIGPGQWAEFMCFNLGASYNGRDATRLLTTGWENIGAYWQWGKLNSSVVGPFDNNLDIYAKSISGWNRTKAIDFSWKDTEKSPNDPCPPGFRIPTISQWKKVFENNPIYAVGASNGVIDKGYSSGVMLGKNLFLPSAGARSINNGALVYSGDWGQYWSSSSEPNSDFAYQTSFTIQNNSIQPNISFIQQYRWSGQSIRCISEKARSILPPQINFESISIISSDSIYLKATVFNDGGKQVKDRGFVVSPFPKPRIGSSQAIKFSNGQDTGTFQVLIRILEPNTKYYFVAFASNEEGVNYSIEKEIVIPSRLPEVKTHEITITGESTAISGGSVLSNGGNPVISKGVVWNTSKLPDILLSSKTNEGSGGGLYSSILSNLKIQTKYYIRAYVTTLFGTAYGEEREFTTNSFPSVTTLAIDSIKATSVRFAGDVNADGGAVILSKGVVWDTCNNPTLTNSQSIITEQTLNENLNCCGNQIDSTKNSHGISKKYKYEIANILFPGQSQVTEVKLKIENGFVFLADDIVLFSEEEYELKKLEKGGIINLPESRWPKGIIPYVIKSGHSLTSRIKEAIAQVNAQTNLCLVPQSNEEIYVEFVEYVENKCFAYVGMQTDRTKNIINVNGWCDDRAIVHEIFHTAGIWHEQQRLDRDQYITVFPENLIETEEAAFQFLPVATPVGEYDYFSIMHYESLALSKNNKPTMLPKSPPAPFFLKYIYRNLNISAGDVATIKHMYPIKNCCVPIITEAGTGLGPFNGVLTGLKPGKTYYLKAFAKNSTGIAYGKTEKFTTLPETPKVLTLPIDSIKFNSAIGGGSVISDGGGMIIAKGVIWDTSDIQKINTNLKTMNGSGLGSFKSMLINLRPGTKYFVRAYATNASGTGFGDPVIFSTSGLKVPNLKNLGVDSITSTGFITATSILDDGGSPVIARGVVWDTIKNPRTTSSAKTSQGTGIGLFISRISGLKRGKLYYLNSYAENNLGTAYGEEVTFQTLLETPKISIEKSSVGITFNSINIRCNVTDDGGGAIISRGAKLYSLSLGDDHSKVLAETNNGSGMGIFEVKFSLNPKKEYMISVYAKNAKNEGRDNFYFKSKDTLPELYTTNIYRITDTSAMSGGQIIESGASAITQRGVVWSLIPRPTISLPTKTVNGSGLGNFESIINGLSPGRRYYLRAYATNSYGTNYGDEENFFTAVGLPTISTTKPNAITETTAISGGFISSTGGTAITQRGVAWSISNDPNVSLPTKTNNGAGSGSFISNLIGLNSGTKYYVRSYATNSKGTAYGLLDSFNTLANFPSLTTTVPVFNSSSTATGGGIVTSDGGAPILSKGVVWGTQSGPTVNLLTKTTDGVGLGSFTSNLTGLNIGNTYYVRAYARNSRGVNYGNEIPFKLNYPIINIDNSISFSNNYVILKGNITSDGGSAIISRGIVWSTSPNPTIALSTKTVENATVGAFEMRANFNLNTCTPYYIRAYATNVGGVSYSSERCVIYSGTSVTTSVSNVTNISALVTDILSLGACETNSARAIFWSTNPNATLWDNLGVINLAAGSGSRSATISNLMPNTTYYVRSASSISDLCKNSTLVGLQNSFTTNSQSQDCGTITDIDGNTYNTVQIGTQCWTKENLRVTKYNDGTIIPLDNSGGTAGNGAGQTWGSWTTGARTIYAHLQSNLTTVGYLYNWYAAKGIATTGSTSYKNLCPAGWHVPTDGEWTALTTFLGGEPIAGGKMKSIGTAYWYSPNKGATNESGFSALPGGFRNNDGRFLIISDRACFWGADDYASRRELYSNGGSVNSSTSSKSVGFSIRCLRDNSSSGLQPNEKTNLVFLDSFPTNTFYSKREVFENEMNLEKAFIVFPNPSSGRVTVRFNNFKTNIPRKMEISDEVGRILREFNFSEMINQFDFDLTSLQGSVFFLKVYYDNGILVEKIFKQ